MGMISGLISLEEKEAVLRTGEIYSPDTVLIASHYPIEVHSRLQWWADLN